MAIVLLNYLATVDIGMMPTLILTRTCKCHPETLHIANDTISQCYAHDPNEHKPTNSMLGLFSIIQCPWSCPKQIWEKNAHFLASKMLIHVRFTSSRVAVKHNWVLLDDDHSAIVVQRLASIYAAYLLLKVSTLLTRKLLPCYLCFRFCECTCPRSG